MSLKVLGLRWLAMLLLATTTLACGKGSSPAEESTNRDSQRQQFEKLAKEWVEQCSSFEVHVSSNDAIILKQEAWRQMVALGPKIAPLVVERMRREKDPHRNPGGRDFYKQGYDPDRLPWGLVLQEVTKHRLDDDAGYRELVREFHRKEGDEKLSKIFDPDNTAYIPEIAVPRLLEWWEKTGVKEFGQDSKKK